MKNPWVGIPLTDYENHMKLDSVHQLQTMNEVMQGQFDAYPVSCVIQINVKNSWVSDSPYLRIFDRLEGVHHQMEEQALEKTMPETSYRTIKKLERTLPDGKKFVQMDFEYI